MPNGVMSSRIGASWPTDEPQFDAQAVRVAPGALGSGDLGGCPARTVRYWCAPKQSIRIGVITSGGALWSYPSSILSCAPGVAAACSATERWNQPGLFLPPR
jgi:hypothetical protein